MTRCESYPPCFGTIYFPTAPFLLWMKGKFLIRCGSEKDTAPDQWHYNQLYFESGIFPVLGKYFPYNTAYKSNSA